MKKCVAVMLMLSVLLTLLAACGKAKLLHCDHCGDEVRVSASSNMEEDWIIYCKTCNEELFGDDPILGTGQ